MNEAYEKIIDNVLAETRKVIINAKHTKRLSLTIDLERNETPLIRYEIEGEKFIPISAKKGETNGE